MKKFIWIFTALFLLSFASMSQQIWELGGQYQYNCGKNLSQHDIGIRYDGFQAKSSWNVGVSYDFGHTKSKDGAKESGFGISAGYGYGFGFKAKSNWFSGAGLTLEFDTWKDKDGKTTSKETVLIPKIELGYQQLYGTAGHFYTTPAVGVGYSMKLKSEGTENKADEGVRYLTRLQVGYRF
jgi:hypothetical protein